MLNAALYLLPVACGMPGRRRYRWPVAVPNLPAHLGRPQRLAGVTLIELMIALAVAAIVLSVGAPAAGQWLRDVEVRSSASALLGALQSARAEAIVRNAPVRLQLTDGLGRPGWDVGCVQVVARCPATIRRQPVSTDTGVRWGAASSANTPAVSTAITAGLGLPAGVTFDALGAAPAVGAGTDIARIDITHARTDDVRRLVILIAAQGMVRLCDPLAATDRPERCQ